MNVEFIVNEAIDSCYKVMKVFFLCKLDIEKAHNYVDLSSLLLVMQKMGFGGGGAVGNRLDGLSGVFPQLDSLC